MLGLDPLVMAMPYGAVMEERSALPGMRWLDSRLAQTTFWDPPNSYFNTTAIPGKCREAFIMTDLLVMKSTMLAAHLVRAPVLLLEGGV